MNTHTLYASEVNKESIAFICECFDKGKLTEEKQKIAHSLWQLQGFLQHIILGEYVEDLSAPRTRPRLNEKDLDILLSVYKSFFDFMEKLDCSFVDENPMPGFEVTSIMSLVVVISTMLEILRDYKEDYLTEPPKEIEVTNPLSN